MATHRRTSSALQAVLAYLLLPFSGDVPAGTDRRPHHTMAQNIQQRTVSIVRLRQDVSRHPLPSSSSRRSSKTRASSVSARRSLTGAMSSPTGNKTLSTPKQRKVRPKSSPPSADRSKMSMYERSKIYLEAREERLKQTEREMMEQCTFTPETNNKSSGDASKDTPVFDRLYNDSKKVTPKKSNASRPSPNKNSPTSIGSSRSSHSRFDKLYEDAVRRNKNRKHTDKEEAEARKRRQERNELKRCTFKPNMDWRGKTRSSPNADSKVKRGDARPARQAERRNNRDRTRSKSSPPVEIVTMKGALPDQKASKIASMPMELISPLREPPTNEDEKKEEPSGHDSIGAATEWGSI